jgi:hypothetical protein
MRKLFWCGSAAGVLALGSLFGAAYFAYCEPDSVIGNCIATAANTSIAMQPVTGLVTMVAQVSRHAMDSEETAGRAGSHEECIPADPQPIAPEAVAICPDQNKEPEAAPIVIHEDDPMPPENEGQAVPATIEIVGLPNGGDVPDNVCPMVMPYCADDEQPAVKPVMPYAEDEAKKPVAAAEESEDKAFKEWMKLFEGSGKDGKDSTAEELPAPKEEASDESKCQEDSRIHEHYSGCPSMTCPYTGKSYPSCAPSTKPGKEESSEVPTPKTHGKKHSDKGGKSEDGIRRTEGLDTMEYRSSDGGLDEFGPGPM